MKKLFGVVVLVVLVIGAVKVFGPGTANGMRARRSAICAARI